MSVNEKRLVIKGATSAAVFYGLMTLDQILAGDICATKQKTIASVEIDDCPRFDYRALMLDPARNFLPMILNSILTKWLNTNLMYYNFI